MQDEKNNITAQGIIDILNHIEYNYSVNNWYVGDCQIWPVLRAELYYYLSFQAIAVNDEKITQKPSVPLTIARSFYTCILHSLKDFKNTIWRNKKCDAVFLGDGVSFAKMGDVYYDRFCDPLIAHLTTLKVRSAKLDPGKQYFIPRHTPSRFIQPGLDMKLILSRLLKKQLPTRLEGYEQMLQYLRDKVPSIPDLSIAYLQTKINTINHYKQYFLKTIRRSAPKLGFVVSYAGDTGFAFIAACKELNVKVTDIQHGVQGPLHAIYGSWAQPDKNGYQLLPDHFLCWSESERNAIQNWNTSRSNVALIGGNAFLEAWRSGTVPVTAYYNRRFKETIDQMGGKKKNVLLTMQYGIIGENDLKNIFTAIQETQHSLNWFIRLHPGMLDKKMHISNMLTRYGITNADMDLSTEAPLYAVLLNMDVHITHSSSAVIEAALFGIKSIVTSKYGGDLFAEEIQKGTVAECLDTSSIIKHLQIFERSAFGVENSTAMEKTIQYLMAEASLD